MLMYQIRRWNDHGRHSWELWRCIKSPGSWPFVKYHWEQVSEYESETKAQAALVKIVGSHYDSIVDYDENGNQIFYGW